MKYQIFLRSLSGENFHGNVVEFFAYSIREFLLKEEFDIKLALKYLYKIFVQKLVKNKIY